MNNLFYFITKNIHWLLFFLLTSFSLYLLVHNSEFQQSKYFAVSQEIAGRAYSVSSSVQSYLNLRTTNTELTQRICTLEEEVQRYKKELENLSDRIQPDSINMGIDQPINHYTHALVTQKQVYGADNFIILNKGSKLGITEDMAVVSTEGIVGVVSYVTPNFSRVLPVINPTYHPTCFIKNTKFFGTLFWDGKDTRYITLSRLPGHASYATGDTIVTSGYSDTFPEGVLVGIIEDTFRQKNEEYNSLKVRLFTDFSTLSDVFVIDNPLRNEQLQIEKGTVEK